VSRHSVDAILASRKDEETTVKKSKVRTKPAATRKPARPAKPIKKIAGGQPRAAKASAAGRLAEENLLAEAIADLAAITAELRGIANDLRELISESEEPGSGVEAVLITEVDSPEGPEEESG
jgi:hypothetical protein